MNEEKSKAILDKTKSLEGITEHEWNEIKADLYKTIWDMLGEV